MIETKLDKLHGPTYDAQSAAVSSVDSVTQAFEGWFDTSMRDLPEVLRHRVERDFFAMPWDDMTPDKRRSVARHWDCQHDPATEQERQFWEDFFERESAVKVQIAQWGVVATPTAGDLDLSESRLKELRQELARMETQQRRARGDGYPERKLLEGDNEAASTSQGLAVQYVAYPKAMHQLSERLNATPEELAAWVWLGPKDGGLAAYLNVNELDPPPRFYQDSGKGWGDHDYVSPLMACWFSADAISRFDPGHRYITGSALIERWSKRPELKPVAFIQAKICESRLLDLHPICGLTQGSCPEDASGPPLTTGLFRLSDVEAIEVEDFAVVQELGGPWVERLDAEVGSPEWRSQNARTAANAKHDKPGGSRDKQNEMRVAWASGKYSSREVCAEQECAALGMSFAAARKALRNTPDPSRC